MHHTYGILYHLAKTVGSEKYPGSADVLMAAYSWFLVSCKQDGYVLGEN